MIVLVLLTSVAFANKNYAQMIEDLLISNEMISEVQVIIEGEDLTVRIWIQELDEGLLEFIQKQMALVYDIYPFDSISFEIYDQDIPVFSINTQGDLVEAYLEGELTLEEWADQIVIEDLQLSETITQEQLIEKLLEEPEVLEETVEEVETEVEEIEPEEEVVEEVAEEVIEEATEEVEEEAATEPVSTEEASQGLSTGAMMAIAGVVVVVAAGGFWIYKKRIA